MPAEGFRGVADAARNGSAVPMPEIPGFMILERIGKGGMGEVYLARQLALGRLVAIKFLRPEGSLDPETDTARFRREAELMAKVSHPNILSIFDFGETGGYYYLVVEFAEGGDLRKHLTPGSPLSIDHVRPIVLPVGEALAHLHRQGIVHRDLKPENILLNEEGKPIVSDFGISIARATTQALTRTGRGAGTLGYVAPEQQYGLKVDERADQYSLAALTYEMLTGHLPLGIFKPPSLLNPRAGLSLDEVILRALQENPRDRFETIGEFNAQLDRALVVPRPAVVWPMLQRHGWVALPLLALAGAVLSYSARSPREQGPPVRLAVRTGNQPAPKPDAAPKKAEPAEDPLLHKMKERLAYEIWEESGRPGGEAGKAAELENWLKASALIEAEVEGVAYQLWVESGSPKGEEGERASRVNRDKAIRQVYRKMTGQDPPPPRVEPAGPGDDPRVVEHR